MKQLVLCAKDGAGISKTGYGLGKNSDGYGLGLCADLQEGGGLG